MKIAVATKEGISINLHFGHASQFWIYDVDGDSCELIGKREVDHYCHGQHGDPSAMQKILHTIKDCDAVFVAMIGDGPREKLKKINVEAVDQYGHEAIDTSLLDYIKGERA